MKIVVDNKIPYLQSALRSIADEVVCLPSGEIDAAAVRDADVLLVRTRTRVDAALLEGSRVGFVGTATIGIDHLSLPDLQRLGIRWMSCPGCNADSVAQYVRSVFILLKRERGMIPERTTVGVVGCGHVGSRVCAAARQMGMEVLVCDPPLADAGGTGLTDMDSLLRSADILTFHVPLTEGGRYPTHHLVDTRLLSRLEKPTVLINTSRGGVVDGNALLSALQEGMVSDAIIDTWENEPHINRRLLEAVYIGTPHIAGYSADGKVNASNMILEGLCRYLGIANRWHIEPPPLPESIVPATSADDRALQLYNPHADSLRLKQAPERFEQLRNDYPLRREKFNDEA